MGTPHSMQADDFDFDCESKLFNEVLASVQLMNADLNMLKRMHQYAEEFVWKVIPEWYPRSISFEHVVESIREATAILIADYSMNNMEELVGADSLRGINRSRRQSRKFRRFLNRGWGQDSGWKSSTHNRSQWDARVQRAFQHSAGPQESSVRHPTIPWQSVSITVDVVFGDCCKRDMTKEEYVEYLFAEVERDSRELLRFRQEVEEENRVYQALSAEWDEWDEVEAEQAAYLAWWEDMNFRGTSYDPRDDISDDYDPYYDYDPYDNSDSEIDEDEVNSTVDYDDYDYDDYDYDDYNTDEESPCQCDDCRDDRNTEWERARMEWEEVQLDMELDAQLEFESLGPEDFGFERVRSTLISRVAKKRKGPKWAKHKPAHKAGTIWAERHKRAV